MEHVADCETAEPRTLPRSAVCVLTIDATHRIAHANLEFEQAFGHGQGGWLALPLQHCCHPDMPPAVLRDVWATLEAGATWVAPLKWRCSDGNALWARTTFAPMQQSTCAGRCMVVSTHVAASQVRAAERVYLAMSRWDLAWRAAIEYCNQRPMAGRADCRGHP